VQEHSITPISRLSVLTVMFEIGQSLCIRHRYLFTVIILMVALSPCYMPTAGSCSYCSLEVGISHNVLQIVTQPGEGLCSVATQSNSPRHSRSVTHSINQSINCIFESDYTGSCFCQHHVFYSLQPLYPVL
jgi:hypothetical protein